MVKQWYYQNVQNVVVKNQDFIINQDAKGLLSNLGLRTTPLSKVSLLGVFSFNCMKNEWNCS